MPEDEKYVMMTVGSETYVISAWIDEDSNTEGHHGKVIGMLVDPKTVDIPEGYSIAPNHTQIMVSEGGTTKSLLLRNPTKDEAHKVWLAYTDSI